MTKTISVWLTLKDGKNEGKVILQKRSLKNKTFPFICQATWAGKVEPREKVECAVWRECKEEMGNKFSDSFNFSGFKTLIKCDFIFKAKKWESFNYFGEVSQKMLSNAKLHNEALPGFIFIEKGDKFYPIDSRMSPEKNIVLFNDQYEILKNLLK